MQPGKFFFVVGPSGSGKDSLISGVMPLLPNNQFLLARRVITRQALLHTEDHDSCSAAEFLEREISGDFIITWTILWLTLIPSTCYKTRGTCHC
jgi:thymidine phosphorylase